MEAETNPISRASKTIPPKILMLSPKKLTRTPDWWGKKCSRAGKLKEATKNYSCNLGIAIDK